MIGRDHSRLRGKVALAAASWLNPSGYDACKKVKGLKRHVLVLLNVVVHPADIQNRDRGRAGRYDYSRSIERIFAKDAYAGRKRAMAATSFVRLATNRIMIS